MYKFRILITFAAAISVSLMSTPTFASGSGGFNNYPSRTVPRQVDEIYEHGKALFKGRVDGAEKIKYCVKVDGEVKKLKRSTVKQYRKSSAEAFAYALVDCADPERLALTTMGREQAQVVLYYLNKRYALDLRNEADG